MQITRLNIMPKQGPQHSTFTMWSSLSMHVSLMRALLPVMTQGMTVSNLLLCLRANHATHHLSDAVIESHQIILLDARVASGLVMCGGDKKI